MISPDCIGVNDQWKRVEPPPFAAYFAKATKARKASTVAEAMADKMADKQDAKVAKLGLCFLKDCKALGSTGGRK